MCGICCATSVAYSQIQPPADWYLLDPKIDSVNGISLNKAYAAARNLKSHPVIVAIIDSGVDIYHEDLEHAIWVNADEIPNNGIDDDQNGYIDDIHGWNFIGGKNGENVKYETLEITRLYGKLKSKYADISEENVRKKDLQEYELYIHAKSEVEKNRSKILNALKPIETEEQIILSAFRAVREEMKTDTIDIAAVELIKENASPFLSLGKQIILSLYDSELEFETYSEIEAIAKKEYAAKMEAYRIKLNYSFNHEYNSRVSIVGDDYENSYDRLYGNNDVVGPDAFHGTHVAGIIAANRHNQSGIRGIADDVYIMSIRTVPDGDERDKDVANAILYAADNGASIINMSFGKYYTWDKEAVDAAIRYAESKDVLIIHAAGNNANDNDSKIHYPSDRLMPKWFLGRRYAKNWIEVGALSWHQNDKAVASFSNYGRTEVDFFAPGVAIKSTAPENNYAVASGTSMAAPVVAGISALIRSYFPALTAAQVKEILKSSVLDCTYQVILPGDHKQVQLEEICVAGGIANAYTAIRKAQRTKGKKKNTTGRIIRP
ncbi:MAG: S8 family peptidase [Bacteroidia bacterium]|nr:S8 family peptidase [Bacteroidia bacterium]